MPLAEFSNTQVSLNGPLWANLHILASSRFFGFGQSNELLSPNSTDHNKANAKCVWHLLEVGKV